jgi:hypothetical protein
MDIEQLTKDFKNFEELKAFCASQLKQILIMSKKIKDLEEKNKQLSSSSKEVNNLALVSTEQRVPTNKVNLLVEDDAKTIAQVQLRMLREEAFNRELTLEEVKKLDIFNKVLNVKEEKDNTIKASAKTLSDDELMAQVTNGSEAK